MPIHNSRARSRKRPRRLRTARSARSWSRPRRTRVRIALPNQSRRKIARRRRCKKQLRRSTRIERFTPRNSRGNWSRLRIRFDGSSKTLRMCATKWRRLETETTPMQTRNASVPLLARASCRRTRVVWPATRGRLAVRPPEWRARSMPQQEVSPRSRGIFAAIRSIEMTRPSRSIRL